MAILARFDYSNTHTSGTQVNGQVYIILLDADTLHPVNGNYVSVTYTKTINGVTTNQQVTIPGQSYAIFTGTISDSDPAHPVNVTFGDLIVGEISGGGPPVNSCDLVINYVNIDKQESAPGAGDAQITVTTFSSYGPIQYSLDNNTFQTLPTFTGLTGGLKTVYVKDSNNCTAQSIITIPVQNSLLVADPSITIPGGKISRWNAAFNPVIFSYQRKDFEVIGAELDTLTGNTILSVNCDTSLIKSTLAANQAAKTTAAKLNVVIGSINPIYAYVSTSAYAGVYEIENADAQGKLTLNAPYTSTATGFININLLRPYYQVRTQITYIDALTGRQNTITSTNRPDNTGLVKADLSNFLQSLLQAKDDSSFSQVNHRDKYLSASYQVAYAEYWDGKLSNGAALTYNSIADTYYVVYAAKQLGERYGGNLAAYVPFKSVVDANLLAKWVTDFNEPAYSDNYPFDIGFIYSDDLIGLQLYCELTMLDINRNPLPGGTQNAALLNEDSTWLLNQDGSKLIIADPGGASFPVPAQLGLNRLRIDTSFGPEVYYFNLTLKYDDETGTHAVTQTQTIRIDDAVDDRSVYLRWIGLCGCWNYYRFVYNQEYHSTYKTPPSSKISYPIGKTKMA